MSVYETLSETQQFACRVIADHARATAFAIADGILPSNEGRNYVLRKIMRRAIYHGREHLGYNDPFFFKVCDFVVEQMREAYPELEVQRDFIGKMVRLEEERFGNTITVGLGKLNELLKQSDYVLDPELPLPGVIEISDLAKLYDTYGTPVDLMYVVLSTTYPKIASQYGDEFSYWRLRRSFQKSGKEFVESFTLEVPMVPEYDEEETIIDESRPVFLGESVIGERDFVRIVEEDFRRLVEEELRKLQKNAGIGQTERKSQINPKYQAVLDEAGPSRFMGYETTHVEGARVKALLKGNEEVSKLVENENGEVVLDKTPFYAESGGQVGDTGTLLTNHGAVMRVVDTFAPLTGLIIHKVVVEKGVVNHVDYELFIGGTAAVDSSVIHLEEIAEKRERITATVDVQKRDATRRNHTATHLVHAALREVLGTHVKQAGSVVAPSYLRFDFTHYQPITEAEITEIEDLVNRYILENHPVNTNVMAIEEAMRGGAMALFGEKYGSDVRVLSVGDGVFSKELCGGTHVKATGDIGAFKITSDEAIASGVRRIRAITGFDAFERFREDEKLIDRALGALKTQRDNLPSAIEKLQEELKRTRKEIDELKLKIATGTIGEASSNGDEARDIAGIKVLGKIVEGLDANGTRQLSDTLLSRMKSGVVVLGRKDEGKVSIIVRVSDDLTDKIKAGNVIKEIIPIVAGKGGGKPDMAEGGGSEPDKLGEAIDASYGVIEKMLV